MTAIISHSSARDFYRMLSKPLQGALPPDPKSVYGYTLTRDDVTRAQRYLNGWNLSDEELEAYPLETMVFTHLINYRIPGCIQHATKNIYSNSTFYQLESNLFVVSVELCALQAALQMEFAELVEYYYELCGSYTISYKETNEYRERPPLTSVQKLARFFNSVQNVKGSKLARRAIQYVRNGCRSPLETAFVLTLCLPKSEGGLGIRDFDVDYCIDVTEPAQLLTRRRYFYFDVYLPRSKTDLEYNGFYHDAQEVQTIDEERKNALACMGYRVISINRNTFFDKASFQRAMLAIMRCEGIRPSRLPQGFNISQEQLRRFVLRRYLHSSSSEAYRESLPEGAHRGLYPLSEIDYFDIQ